MKADDKEIKRLVRSVRVIGDVYTRELERKIELIEGILKIQPKNEHEANILKDAIWLIAR